MKQNVLNHVKFLTVLHSFILKKKSIMIQFTGFSKISLTEFSFINVHFDFDCFDAKRFCYLDL